VASFGLANISGELALVGFESADGRLF